MLLFSLLIACVEPKIVCGKIIDSYDKQPISSAMVYTKSDTVWTNLDGSFQIPSEGGGYKVRILGFNEAEVENPINGQVVEMSPLIPGKVRIIRK